LDKSDAPVNNKLRTVTEFITMQFYQHIKAVETHAGIPLAGSSVLVTGGGAFNTFLISRLQALGNLQMVIPSPNIIAFKEAIAMAFIGVLRLRNQPNVLASVTGASRDTVNGAVYFA
jgi:anhydro-N-acetylmuramic acid kinase